jgi:hypothetical protein
MMMMLSLLIMLVGKNIPYTTYIYIYYLHSDRERDIFMPIPANSFAKYLLKK